MSGKNEQAVIALACQIVKLQDRVRIWKQTALTHENEAMSARADAVARAEADRVRIEGLAKELRLERETCTETADLLNRESEKVRGLSVQAQDQRSEIERLRDEAAKYKTERDHFYQREGIEAKKRMDVEEERDALRAEVAALQERLRASIARGDFAQMEVAAPKPQTPKHPVKVGEWVKAPLGTRGKVVSLGVDYLEVELTNGPPTRWWPVYMCEPCDPPDATAKLTPKVGDTVRLVTHPERDRVAEHLHLALQWPWIDRWGVAGQTGKVVKPPVAVHGTVAVALDDSTFFARWPIDCLEVVAEATHDTEAGKSAALLINGGLDVRKVTT